MPKLFQNLAKSRNGSLPRFEAIRRSLLRLLTQSPLLLASSLIPLPSSLLYAIDGQETMPAAQGGGVIKFTGAADKQWITNPDGTQDLLLKYTVESAADSEFGSTFTFPGATKAEMLMVGGGGGGGASLRSGFISPLGGGAGGGAGGFLDFTNFFPQAVYSVSVGVGGAGANNTTKTTETVPGGDGGDTKILQDGADWKTAYGGGGGGGLCAGKPGGSGGGGSQGYNSSTRQGIPVDGGVATDIAQGNNGGSGRVALFGGGGGGAGGPGGDASTSNPTGGVGRASWITGEEKWFAGGGGGGWGDKNKTSATEGIAGGKGGGGQGGVGRNTGIAAGEGEPETGGGGGGGNANNVTSPGGANGGSGVVYIRISMAFEGNVEKPETSDLEFDNAEHVLVRHSAAYTIKLKDGTILGGDYLATTTGVYEATLTLLDGVQWSDGTTDPFDFRRRIIPAETEIAAFSQKGWMFGTPDTSTPRPRVDVKFKRSENEVPDLDITYEYKKDDGSPAEEGWSPTKPTEIGAYLIRATLKPTADYYGTSAVTSFSITKGLGNLFVDYVEIELGGYHAGGELTNFPYRIALDEPQYDDRGLLISGLPGFLYERAGETGDELAFTDKDGNVLDYTIAKWDVRGESALVVKVPLIASEPQVIRLYWMLRPGATAPDHHPDRVYSDWKAEDAQALYGLLTHEFDLVVKDGFKIDYWTSKPTLSKTQWSDEDGKSGKAGVLSGEATVADGATVDVSLRDAFSGEAFTFDQAKVRGGSYRISYTLRNPEPREYEDLVFNIDFCVTKHTTYDDIRGSAKTLTLSGRVMLANDDVAPGHEVTDQGYWQTDPEANKVYWVHEGTHSAQSQLPNVRSHQGTSHRLYAVDGDRTSLLWRFEDVVIGNMFYGETLQAARIFLPWSSTGVSIASAGATETGVRDGAGQIILRNTLDAKVFSPCYSNGIGTIYFDAANARNDFTGYQTAHRIAVEVATETDDGLPPTDENACEAGSYELTKINTWKRKAIIALRRDNGAATFTRLDPPTETVDLDISTGGSKNNFFRLCVPVNVSGPVRFRIVRLSNYSKGVADGSGQGYVLLDNIIVSPAKMSAHMEPLGSYDDTKLGKQALGWEGGKSVPFPSVTGTEKILVGGRAVTESNGAAGIDPATFVLLARFWYRDRYLNQRLGTPKPVDLSPGNGFRATDPLVLPRGAEGDVEYWYELFTNIPVYDYYDYSGADPARKTKLGGLYAEASGFVTNHLDTANYARVTSGGKEWFFRFRSGASDWSGCHTVFNGTAYPMELIGDHLWRALVKLPKGLSGEIPFHFAATNRWEAWGEAPSVAVRRWYPAASVTKLPYRGESLTVAPVGKTVAVDGASGYLEFQFSEETGIYSVGHAEYQEFSGWNDAKVYKDGSKEWFKGNYSETSGVNTAEQILTNAQMNAWALWNRSLSDWNEMFKLGSYIGDEKSGYPKYTRDYIATHRMPGSWDGANGIFVDETMTESNLTKYAEGSGIAWQMQGRSKGSVSYTSGDCPSGLDEVTFRARLAQMVKFDDFSAMEGDGSTLKNATFLFPAVMSTANGTDLSPNASMSLVGYYRASRGCYEFRVTKRFTNGLLLEIYKWTPDEETDEMAATCLGSVWYSGATFQHSDPKGCHDSSNLYFWPKAFGFFISIDTTTVAGEAKILAGLTQVAYDPSAATYNGTGTDAPAYRAIEVVDDDPLEKGAFGALSTNCRGIFLAPQHWSEPVSTVTGLSTPSAALRAAWPKLTKIATSAKVLFSGTKSTDGDRIKDDDWDFPLAREEKAVYPLDNFDSALYGLNTPDDLKQKVGVYLKPQTGSAGWTLFKEEDVTGFSLVPHTVQVRTNANLQVMLKAGAKATDVTVHTITQNAWNGEDINNMGGISEDFIYTQSCIEERVTDGEKAGTKVTNRVTRLMPARAKAGMPVSVRSPVLKGLGMIGFRYDGVKPGCRILVQVATNDVRRSLSGTGGYNTSTNCVPFGGEQTVGTWMTIRAYDADELGESGEQTYYLGWHDRKDDPLEGVFRVTIDPGVAMEAAKWGPSNPEWGSVTLTDVYVRNEPPIDDRSWLGWNIRVLGDGTDEERRMYLPDLYGENGLGNSAALNDSFNDIVGKRDEYDKHDPYIQSPTFGSYLTPSGEVRKATVGQIRFRARLYDNTGSADPKVAKVSLYGAKDGSATAWGDPVETFAVSNRDFRIYEYKAPAGTDYAAMRLVIDGVTKGSADAVRVLFDEIVVSEKSDSKVGFVYARPFRTGLGDDWVVTDILDKSQQPLAGESWGVQTQLRLDQLANDIDVERGFRVTLQYHEGIDVWGWQNWAGKSGSSEEVDLVQVGAKTNLIFRSTASDPKTVVPPSTDGDATVQYLVTVYYYQRGSDVLLSQPITSGEWTNPEWYEPVDLNAKYDDGSGTRFSPYTILESVAPGRVWINEVNFNDGGRDLNRGYDSVTNQFVEIAVPWGIDLTGWELHLTDVNKNSTMLARLGENGVPAKKDPTAYASDRYEFLVLVSPKTADQGGVTDPKNPGRKVMDGTWIGELPYGTFNDRTMMYEEPYQFELRRPSGIVEHQFVVGGTNELRGTDWESMAYLYDGTNLVRELNEIEYSPKRFYAGDDLARKADGRTLSSFGVVGAGHGEEGPWSAEKGLTPGRLNEDQEALTGWWIDPLGGAIWIYAQVFGEHLVQRIGDDTKANTFFVVNSGSSTSIQYKAAAWYGIGALTVNGVTNTEAVGKSDWTLNLNNVTETTYVVAREGLSGILIDAGLDPADRYAPAVQNWLAARTAAGTLYNSEGPIVLGKFKGLKNTDVEHDLELKDMYWLDMDPTLPGWWLRGGMSDIYGTPVYRKRVWNSEWTEHYTNWQVTVTMYLTNETDNACYAPYRLQGLANEQSDTFGGTWTSETFQITAMLPNGLPENVGFLPFRCFIFNTGSFDANFESTIEILDPFSQSSPGQAYGWTSWRDRVSGLWFKWNLGDVRPPAGVDTLKAEDTYDGPPYEDDD